MISFHLQQEPGIPDSRPSTTSNPHGYDPLALDLEDLYVKYKVGFSAINTGLMTKVFCLFCVFMDS